VPQRPYSARPRLSAPDAILLGLAPFVHSHRHLALPAFRIASVTMGLICTLISTSALSVYKWEKGEVRPRAKHIAAIAAIRSIGKKEAEARLNLLSS
jgi:hypothetical protein